jgi:Peptidase C13 family
MHLLTLFILLISFLECGSETALAQALPGSQQASTDGTSNLTWKATLMTGDDSLDVFDNARKALKSEFLDMGVIPANIKELSMNPRERKRGSLPSSTVNLAGALRELSIGDQDACLIHMTSHGSPQGFYLRNAPSITPQMLNRILDTACSERPTVVLISACYSGVFVGPSMQKKNRIILTAARQDRTSFGCSAENQYTYWDACLIDSLPTTESWKSLYAIIQRCVETKESQGHFRPSLPQAYFGEQVSDLKIPKTVPAALSVVLAKRHAYVESQSVDVLSVIGN